MLRCVASRLLPVTLGADGRGRFVSILDIGTLYMTGRRTANDTSTFLPSDRAKLAAPTDNLRQFRPAGV